MADDFDDGAKPGGAADPLAVHFAAAASGPAAEEARQYLREQTELARLQKQNLIEQNAFELSHLRWRRLNDQLKGAMQIMLVAVGALIVIAIGAALWSASQASGLVVDSFSTPLPLASSTGMDGDTLASDLTNKIGTVRDIANSTSLDNSADVRNGHKDIKVEIPDTGVSLAEVWRYLKMWLGHERHVSGYLRTKGPDRFALTVALDGARSFTVEGSDLDKLEQQAAERVFATVDPLNYVLYLDAMGRRTEALAQAARVADLMTTPAARADAYSLWSFETRNVAGDLKLAEARIALSVAADPRSAPPRVEMIRDGSLLGHDEEALAAARALQTFRREDQQPSMQGAGFDEIMSEAAHERNSATGDFRQGLAEDCVSCSPAGAALVRAYYLARSYDVAGARILVARAAVLGGADPQSLAIANYWNAAAAGDWQAAIAATRAYSAALGTTKYFGAATNALSQRTQAAPLLAEAQARAGHIAGARDSIASTPRDCYNCVRVRGVIEAIAGNPAAAAAWFTEAVKQAPSIPFAYNDWGEMLLAKGDVDGAVAKFATAHEKGPHFADPLEMWGEALIAKNRSDLAVAKFQEANKYAPNWGRLHLKWGEALLWSGDHAAAQKQFATAAHLSLTPSEKSELARMGASHGR